MAIYKSQEAMLLANLRKDYEAQQERIAKLESDMKEMDDENAQLKGGTIAADMMIAEQGKRVAYLKVDLNEMSIELNNWRVFCQKAQKEEARLRKALDDIKVRCYEMGNKQVHDMALNALKTGASYDCEVFDE